MSPNTHWPKTLWMVVLALLVALLLGLLGGTATRPALARADEPGVHVDQVATPAQMDATATASFSFAVFAPDAVPAVTFVNDLDARLTLVDATSTAGPCNGTAQITCALAMHAGTPAAVTLRVRLRDPQDAPVQIPNQATVRAPDGTTATANTVVLEIGRADAPPTPATATATPVPATATRAPTMQAASTATTLNAASATVADSGLGPDRCEPNDDPTRACTIALDSVNGPFTFVPAGDRDWYTTDLGAPGSGLATTMTVRAAGDLDLLTTITRPDGAPLGSISSPAISITLATDVTGPIRIRVENRSPADARQSSYGIELRRTLPPAPTGAAARDPALQPDILENNYDFNHAATVAISTVYDLNFVCPDLQNGCAHGDHDFLRVPVKAGTTYVFATFDLGPGADTVMHLFWGTEDVPISGNDDAGPLGFASLLIWPAPTNGDVILRIGPRNGNDAPVVLDPNGSRYRFAVAIAGTTLAQDLIARVRSQTEPPATPTPTARPVAPVSGGGSVPPRAPAATVVPVNPPPANPSATTPPANPPAATPAATAVVSGTVDADASASAGGTAISDAATGAAVVVAPVAVLRAEPKPGADAIQELPAGTRVQLTGKAKGAWVRVVTPDGVMPGWTPAAGLRLVDAGAAGAAAVGRTRTLSSTGTFTPTVAQADVGFTVAPLADAALPPAAPVPPRTALTIAVTVQRATAPLLVRTPTTRATPVPTAALPGVRVQLVTVFGDVLAEALTAADGTVTLTRDVAPGSAVWLRLPAQGIDLPVTAQTSPVILTLAAEGAAS